MERKTDGTVVRLALLVERESRLLGVDVEQETQKIIEKLRRHHHVESSKEGHPPAPADVRGI